MRHRMVIDRTVALIELRTMRAINRGSLPSCTVIHGLSSIRPPTSGCRRSQSAEVLLAGAGAQRRLAEAAEARRPDPGRSGAAGRGPRGCAGECPGGSSGRADFTALKTARTLRTVPEPQ